MSVDVSIIVLNYNGKDFLEPCIESLQAQEFPREKMEIILVDNGSNDGSVEAARQRWPDVVIHELSENLGFAGGINEGAARAQGEFIGLINNDARADRYWVANGLAGFRRGLDIGIVGSKILTYDGKYIDYAGGALSFYGHGFKIGVDEPDLGQYEQPKDTLFASGCAMFIPRILFLESGGFDSDYFAFFEDVDLGWRLWVSGFRVVYEPSSIVFHHHHGTAAEKLGRERERFLLERNALATMIKNYEPDRLGKLLPLSLMLSVERGLSYSNIDRAKYKMAGDKGAALDAREQLSTISAAHLLAVSDVCRGFTELLEKREKVQRARKRPDAEIMALFHSPVTPNIDIEHREYHETFQRLVKASGVEENFKPATNVLVITADTVSPKMAGPAIRAWEMSNELSRKHNVRLLVKSASGRTSQRFSLGILDKRTLGQNLRWADVVVFQGFILNSYPQIAQSGKILVADLYDPFHLENLEMFREDAPERRVDLAEADLRIINEQLRVSDFFICASEKQRDFWLGQLTALGRLNPRIYDRDPTLRMLIDVVPFGVSSDPPLHSKPALKGVVPGIGKDDKVILWGGGIYNWFDPLTLIKAMDQLQDDHPELKLFFMGMNHPNPDVPQMRMATAAASLADQLGLTGLNVFFNHGWVPYEERASYLLESDIGISCHLQHVETTYSFRTRVLDYFWAELPIIVTRGDALSEIVEQRSLGLTVEAGDTIGLASAIRRMVEEEDLRRECRLNVSKLRPELSWSQTIRPLDQFCSTPRRAPDKSQIRKTATLPASRLRRLPRLVANTWSEGGLTLVVRRSLDRLGTLARSTRRRS